MTTESKTPLTDALRRDSLNSNDLRAWQTLADSLELRLAEVREVLVRAMQDDGGRTAILIANGGEPIDHKRGYDEHYEHFDKAACIAALQSALAAAEMKEATFRPVIAHERQMRVAADVALAAEKAAREKAEQEAAVYREHYEANTILEAISRQESGTPRLVSASVRLEVAEAAVRELREKRGQVNVTG